MSDKNSLSALQRALLEKLIRSKPSSASAHASVIPRLGHSNGPLSFAQQQLYFIEQLTAGSPVYTVFRVFRMRGNVDIEALEKSLNTIVQRHEILRTTFPIIDGQPRQKISPHSDQPLICNAPGALSAKEAETWLRQEAERPFDLAEGPLFRRSILRLRSDEWMLQLAFHHTIIDGWSLDIFYRELSGLYASHTRKQPHALPELTVQYSDYAAWQRNRLQHGYRETLVEYWKRQLAGAPALLRLPTDYPRPPIQSFRGDRHSHRIREELVMELEAIACRAGCTMFMTLLAAIKALFFRYSGQTDILIGSPITTRTEVELEPLIGFFVNMLVLRTKLSGIQSFSALLEEVRRTALEAYNHQALPFDQLVDELHIVRSASHSPLFQVSLAFHTSAETTESSIGAASLLLPGIEIQPVPVQISTARFDISIEAMAVGPELEISWEFNADLFEKRTIQRMGEHLTTLLEELARNPQRPLAEFPMLSETERQTILNASRSDNTPLPSGSLMDLFEQQVQRNPQRLALDYGEAQWTYDELDQQTNKLAHYLREEGVLPGSQVGLYLDDSAAFVLAVVATLKAGAAYVPLDPTYPSERLAQMIEDAAVAKLITNQQETSIPNITPSGIVNIQADRWNHYPTRSHPRRSSGDMLAYIMYTSGSTGRPKGIMIPQRAITRLLFNTNYVKLGPDDRIAQISNLSFDALTFELWGALLHGGCIVGIRREIVLSAQELAQELDQRHITTMFITSALFNVVAQQHPTAFKNTRYLIVGGDVVDPASARAVLAYGAPQHLLNGYGPTESTTFATWFEITTEAAAQSSIPIGYPLSNTSAYIVDANLNLVPSGVVGELYLGGEGLAWGYQNQPALTAQRFVPNPFGTKAGTRLYRTGDLVRRRPDGAIEFLGRLDNQVKVRGFRIELAEIETAIKQHPKIQEAVAMAYKDEYVSSRIIAYVVAPDVQTLAIREFLKRQLPDYMVPEIIIALDQFPLTPNKKIDRSALPKPVSPRTSNHNPSPLIKNSLELSILESWRNTLKIEQIDLYDNFFDIGGHSLRLIELQKNLLVDLGAQISIMDLYQHPTISSLAGYIRSKQAKTPLSHTSIQRGNQRRQITNKRRRIHGAQQNLNESNNESDPVEE